MPLDGAIVTLNLLDWWKDPRHLLSVKYYRAKGSVPSRPGRFVLMEASSEGHMVTVLVFRLVSDGREGGGVSQSVLCGIVVL